MADYPPGRIDGTRLVLRPPMLEDAGAIFQRVARDPEVTKYLLWTPHPDVAATRRVITEKLNISDDDRTWAITLRNSGDVIGLASCRRPVRHSVEIGYCIGRRWWGKGYMPEVLDMLLTTLQADGTSIASGAPRMSTTSGPPGAATSRFRARGPAGPARRLPHHGPRAAGQLALRQGPAVTPECVQGEKSRKLLPCKHTQRRNRTLDSRTTVTRLRLPPA